MDLTYNVAKTPVMFVGLKTPLTIAKSLLNHSY
jgi:hypothetical protein